MENVEFGTQDFDKHTHKTHSYTYPGFWTQDSDKHTHNAHSYTYTHTHAPLMRCVSAQLERPPRWAIKDGSPEPGLDMQICSVRNEPSRPGGLRSVLHPLLPHPERVTCNISFIKRWLTPVPWEQEGRKGQELRGHEGPWPCPGAHVRSLGACIDTQTLPLAS